MSTPADAEAHDYWLSERPDVDPAADYDEPSQWPFDAAAWRRQYGIPEPPDPWGSDAA